MFSASYCLQFLPLAAFDYDSVNTYYLTIKCVDDNATPGTATTTVEIRLEPNTPPFFGTAGSGRAPLSFV